MDFELLRLKKDQACTVTGKLKKARGKITFLCDNEVRYYCISGFTSQQFTNWAKREYSYLNYTVEVA